MSLWHFFGSLSTMDASMGISRHSGDGERVKKKELVLLH